MTSNSHHIIATSRYYACKTKIAEDKDWKLKTDRKQIPHYGQ